jgi:hypothetical protein
MDQTQSSHTEQLKSVLHKVFLADKVVNKFHNKVQFMNLNFLMSRADTWSEEKLKAVDNALETIGEQLSEVMTIIEKLEAPTLALVESYALEQDQELERALSS